LNTISSDWTSAKTSKDPNRWRFLVQVVSSFSLLVYFVSDIIFFVFVVADDVPKKIASALFNLACTDEFIAVPDLKLTDDSGPVPRGKLDKFFLEQVGILLADIAPTTGFPVAYRPHVDTILVHVTEMLDDEQIATKQIVPEVNATAAIIMTALMSVSDLYDGKTKRSAAPSRSSSLSPKQKDIVRASSFSLPPLCTSYH